MLKSSSRIRFERRVRKQRIEWLRKNWLKIATGLVIAVLVIAGGYIFWYNYIPSDINAADGQVKVYVEYNVTSGDTLDDIAARYYKNYGYDRPCSFENEVIHINNLHGRINYLQVDQVIKLPKIVNVEVYEPYRIE